MEEYEKIGEIKFLRQFSNYSSKIQISMNVKKK
jgi:hypothetical protein